MKNIHFFDSNQYRGIISIFATAAIGAMGFVQTAVGYGIPGMEKFTVGALMSGGVACADDDVGCWFSGSIVLGLLVGGTMMYAKRLVEGVAGATTVAQCQEQGAVGQELERPTVVVGRRLRRLRPAATTMH